MSVFLVRVRVVLCLLAAPDAAGSLAACCLQAEEKLIDELHQLGIAEDSDEVRVCQLAKTLLVHLECDVFGALIPQEFLEPLSSYVLAVGALASEGRWQHCTPELLFSRLPCLVLPRYVGMLLWVVGCPAVGMSTLQASSSSSQTPHDSSGNDHANANDVDQAASSPSPLPSGSRTQLLDGAKISFGQFKKVVARLGPLDRNFLGTLYENLIRCVGH